MQGYGRKLDITPSVKAMQIFKTQLSLSMSFSPFICLIFPIVLIPVSYIYVLTYLFIAYLLSARRVYIFISCPHPDTRM